MRKIIVSNLISLDGYYAGPNGEIDWFVNIADKELEEYGINLIGNVDTMLFGRITYELMESYWPTAKPENDAPRIIEAMNNYPKVILSKTLEKVSWKNSTLIKGEAVEEVAKLKQQHGKDIVIYGSGSIVALLVEKDLIDDYRILVCPVILGKGKRMFKDSGSRLGLKLADTKKFESGLVLLHYIR
jgi:dihydrofolate reductase